jgi:hypothetical protein
MLALGLLTLITASRTSLADEKADAFNKKREELRQKRLSKKEPHRKQNNPNSGELDPHKKNLKQFVKTRDARAKEDEKTAAEFERIRAELKKKRLARENKHPKKKTAKQEVSATQEAREDKEEREGRQAIDQYAAEVARERGILKDYRKKNIHKDPRVSQKKNVRKGSDNPAASGTFRVHEDVDAPKFNIDSRSKRGE